MRARFDASRLRGDRVHLREEARYTLHLLGDAPTALRLAQQNWAVQKEPADLRVLLEAALAARDEAALRTALDWIAATRLEDVHLSRLAVLATRPENPNRGPVAYYQRHRRGRCDTPPVNQGGQTMKAARLITPLMTALAIGWLAPAQAASHREAPQIAQDPVADITDVYAFVSYDDENLRRAPAERRVTFIMNVLPGQNPADGPNYFNFGDDVVYRLNIDNDKRRQGRGCRL